MARTAAFAALAICGNTTRRNKMTVLDAKIGDVIDIKNASENPCIKTGHSVIDRWGSNWTLKECGDLECKISKSHCTKAAYREFILQVRNRDVYMED